MVVLIVFGAIGSLMAQETGRRRSGGESNGSLFFLLGMQTVLDELKVTPEQAEKILDIRSELRLRPQPGGVDFRTATDEQRRTAIKERYERIDANERERLAKLKDVLDETQLRRLRDLGAQRYGAVMALTDETIAAELKLTDDQKQQLAVQRDDYRVWMFTTGFGLLRGQAGNDRSSFDAARREYDDKAIAVLMDEQKTAFEAIKGTEFAFEPSPDGASN